MEVEEGRGFELITLKMFLGSRDWVGRELGVFMGVLIMVILPLGVMGVLMVELEVLAVWGEVELGVAIAMLKKSVRSERSGRFSTRL